MILAEASPCDQASANQDINLRFVDKMSSEALYPISKLK